MIQRVKHSSSKACNSMAATYLQPYIVASCLYCSRLPGQAHLFTLPHHEFPHKSQVTTTYEPFSIGDRSVSLM